jgi:hypothetical protein
MLEGCLSSPFLLEMYKAKPPVADRQLVSVCRAGDDLGGECGAIHITCIRTQCDHQCGVFRCGGLYVGYYRGVVHGCEGDADGGEVGF